ncbi:unnamed protein product [Symbiodinium natans]|uniref:Sulfotransferase domain-containing protein n=1 Tax=Symbiodinium natans TaxID=878477 RepID=A0A812UGY0_9DINO|nr:unnamed protein product [Symbiodinium natans]
MVCCVLPPEPDLNGRPLTNWDSFRQRSGAPPALPEDDDDQLHCFESGLLEGLQYRKHGKVLLPRPLTRRVAQTIKKLEFKAQDTLLCIAPELGGHMVQLEECLMQLAEHRCDEVQGLVPFGPWGVRIPPLEAKIAALGQLPPSSSRRQCLMTFVPPKMLPRSSDDQLAVAAKMVVILADPRYVLFRHREIWNRVRWMSSKPDSEFSPELVDLGVALEHYFASDCHYGGYVMDRYRDWMVEQEQSPHKVKIIFLEDLVRDPELVIKGLAHFLEVDDPRVPQAAITRLKSAQVQGGLIKAGLSSAEEVDFMQRISKEVERCLALLPSSAQEKWSSSIGEFLAAADLRCKNLANQLLEHVAWQEPPTWVAHNLMICKPCSFAPRGICRAADACNFCHAPGHAAPTRRPSKKERMRRLRRLQRLVSRTPSPEGLSS